MPNDVPADQLSLTYQDYSREKSTVSIGTRQLADNAAYDAAVSALTSAITSLTTGVLQQDAAVKTRRYSNAPSSDVNAAREDKFLVRMEDNVTLLRYSFTVPCRDDSAVVYALNTDFVDLSGNTVTTDFVAAVEAIYASPAGNPGTVVSIERVGRNN